MADNFTNMTEAYIGQHLIYAIIGHESHKLTFKGKYSGGLATLSYNDSTDNISGKFKTNQLNTFCLPVLSTIVLITGIENVEIYDYPSTALVTTFKFSKNITYISDNVIFDTSSATSMSGTFENAPESLKPYIKNVEKWSTGKVTNFSMMFLSAYIPDELDLSSWDVSRCSSFGYMFHSANQGYKLNLSGWKFRSNCRMGQCLTNCGAKEVNIDGWDFKNCSEDIDFGYVGTGSYYFRITGNIKNISQNVKCTQSYIEHDSIMLIADALLYVDTTKYFTMPARIDKSLTEDEIAIITSKGYTISYS